VIVCSVARSSGLDSTRSMSASLANASRTLPFDVSWSGVRRPTQFTATIDREPLTWSTYTTASPASTPRFTVSCVRSASSSSIGRAVRTRSRFDIAEPASATSVNPSR
jgi:hypothetical protein